MGDTVASMTDGNHGEALALCAKDRGMNVVILIPRNVEQPIIDRLHAMNATVILLDGTYDECIAELRSRAILNGWTIVSDTSWDGYEQIPGYIAHGYCSLFQEAIAQIGQQPTHAFVQAGVGGLLAAAALYLATHSPRTRLICVEPIDAACIYENTLREASADKLLPCSGKTNSNMQGLNCGTPSQMAWPLIQGRVDWFLTISDEWARSAVRELYNGNPSLATCETGAAGVAGLMAVLADASLTNQLELDAMSNVLLICTEGITNQDRFQNITRQLERRNSSLRQSSL